MARGGYRPGAGRPKGSKATKTAAGELQQEPPAEQTPDPQTATPLDYMLRVMNDTSADETRRDRMAIAAAPFMHARKEGAAPGKKDEKQGKAEKVAGGKYGTGRAPLRVVNG